MFAIPIRSMSAIAVTSLVAATLVFAASPRAQGADVYPVSTPAQFKAAIEAADGCTGPVSINVSGVIELDEDYLEPITPPVYGTKAISCPHELTIRGVTADATVTRADTGLMALLWNTSPAGTVVIDSITVSNFETGGIAPIDVNGSLTIVNAMFSNNSATSPGGGVYSSGPLTISDSVFVGNRSAAQGGGAASGSAIVLDNVTAISNHAGLGGAVYTLESITVADSTFMYNTASASHGGGALYAAEATVVNSLFRENEAFFPGGPGLEPGRGGAISVFQNLTVTGSQFAINIAHGNGGAIAQWGTEPGLEVVIDATTFRSNWTEHAGGAIHSVAPVEISRSTLTRNFAGVDGAAMVTPGGGTVEFTTITQNEQPVGSAVRAPAGDLIIRGSVVAGNDPYGAAGECSGYVVSGGYNAIEPGGCMDPSHDTDVFVVAYQDFGLAQQRTIGNAVVVPAAEGGALVDAIPASVSWCAQAGQDQIGDARPGHSGCTIGAVEVPFPAGQWPFRDVGPDHSFVTEITWLADEQISTGYDDGTFRSGHSVSRQAMAAFLMRSEGVIIFVPPMTPTFTDVPRSHAFYVEIEWLADRGITTGYDDGTFRGGANVSRQAMAAFLFRLVGGSLDAPVTTPTFSDVPADHDFFEPIEWMVQEGFTTGYDDGTFRGGANVSRQAMAAFLYRLYTS